jgi:hypothetical protein
MWQTHAKPMVKINHPQSYHSWVGFLNGPKESKTKAARIETPSRVSQKQWDMFFSDQELKPNKALK